MRPLQVIVQLHEVTIEAKIACLLHHDYSAGPWRVEGWISPRASKFCTSWLALAALCGDTRVAPSR